MSIAQMKVEVNLFIPCFVDQVYPQVGIATARVLERVGCRVQYNPKQTCCGQPAYNAGYFDEAADVAEKFLYDFNTDTAHYIVGPSASCVGMVRNGYHLLAAEHPEKLKAHARVKPRTYELSEFLVKVLRVERVPGASYQGKAVFHDSCSGLRECHIYEEPRKLLANVSGLELVPLPGNTECCGFGGTFAVKFEAISVGMAQQKVEHALSTGADTIISTDASCIMQLESYIRKENLPIKTVHLAEVLAGVN